MKDTNSVCIIGRLTRDIEVAYTTNGTAAGKMSIAVKESRKNSDGSWADYANFFEIKMYGKSVESLKPYLIKGKQIAVQGALHQERWEKEGQKNNKIVIAAENIQLIGGNNGQQETAQTETAGDGFNEDIPF